MKVNHYCEFLLAISNVLSQKVQSLLNCLSSFVILPTVNTNRFYSLQRCQAIHLKPSLCAPTLHSTPNTWKKTQANDNHKCQDSTSSEVAILEFNVPTNMVKRYMVAKAEHFVKLISQPQSQYTILQTLHSSL